MSKRTTFTTITPLPPGIARDVVVEFLHNHQEMIDLNPLVKERHCIKPPSHATSDEFHCTWYSLTDRISCLPGGLANRDVTYTCAFHDLPNGIQTHCYAPAGLNIRDKWTLNGSLPGEPVEPVELGTGAPVTGLYIREDVDMRCNVIMASFVKKTLKKSHAALIDRLKIKAQMVSASETNARLASGLSPSLSSASIHSDLSSRSWTPSSSVSSSPPSLQSPVAQLQGKSNTPARISSPYQSPPSTTLSSGFSIRQVQHTPTPPLIAGYTSSDHIHEDQCRYPLPSPHPAQQHSSPPAYGRYDFSPSHQQPQPMSRYMPRQQHNPDETLIPPPLRLRQNSAGSVGSTISTGSIAHGRNASAVIKAQPSVRYRVSHPDYPQMNPYADPYADDHDRQARCRDNAQRVRVGPGQVTVRKTEAVLQGPFVITELEG